MPCRERRGGSGAQPVLADRLAGAPHGQSELSTGRRKVIHDTGRSPRPRVWLFLPFLIFALGAPVCAQSRTSAGLRGTVVDAQGSSVSGALVQVHQENTGVTKTALTNEEGQFLLLLLPPGGPYTLTVQYPGFAEERRERLVLQVGDVQAVDIVLRIDPLDVSGLEVTVDRATVFDPNQVGPATRITERMIESLPVLSRDVLEMAVLSPLVKTTEGGGFSVAGQNDRYNAILVDGLLSKDMFGLTAGGVPGGQAGAKLLPLDAVAQFEVLVAPFDVRLSGFTGGVMNAVTRSGTNQWRARAGGVHRNQALIGDLSLPTGPVDASGVDRSLLAMSLGGPLRHDAVHFFLTGEFERRRQPPDGFNLFRDNPSLIRISEETVQATADVLDDQFGIEAGDAAPYTLTRELANVFGRVDWNFDRGDRLTLRHIMASARNDEAPGRSAFGPYELSSNTVERQSTSNVTSFQLFSEFGARYSNELDLTFQHISDRTTPLSEGPQLEVALISAINDVSHSRTLRLGGDFFGQVNDLEQRSLRLTNSLDVKLGEDIMTVGLTGAWYRIDHAYLPGAHGEYFFASFGDLQRAAPYRFQQTVLAEGQDPSIGFDVLETGAFVQRQIRAGEGLTMHFGLRADVPWVFGRPERNLDIEAIVGYDTSEIPTGNPLLSPRWGFNWRSTGDRRWQVRGGAGFFFGQVPYVWLSNAFHNDGLRSVTRVCEGRFDDAPRPTWAAPQFDPANPPTSCLTPPTSIPPFQDLRTAVIFEPGFKYPQDLKFSAIADWELTSSLTGSLGFLFNKALNQVGVQDLNIEPGAPANAHTLALAGDQRRYYQRVNDDFQQVLLVTNEGEDWAASLTAELRGTLNDRLGFQLGYAASRSWDRMSLVHTDMISNFGLNPTDGDVNKRPLENSTFDRPHKVVAALFGAPIPGLPETEISLLYTGQSGLPFSYVYRGDVNGDGYSGLGGAFDRNNDLLYVPEELSEVPISFVTRILLSRALEEDACLAGFRGRNVRRNHCRAPWEHRLDLRLAQNIDLGSTEVRLEGDLINVFNLVNREWGRVERAESIIPLLELCQVACGGEGAPPATWGGAVLPGRDEQGRLRPTEPWTFVSPDSQWQAQLGVRITFGN